MYPPTLHTRAHTYYYNIMNFCKNTIYYNTCIQIYNIFYAFAKLSIGAHVAATPCSVHNSQVPCNLTYQEAAHNQGPWLF